MKTPSYGIDQNGDNTFKDKYWGRIPKFLHMIPERGICIPNPEYLTILDLFVKGEVPLENISEELRLELSVFEENMCNPCLMSSDDRALLNAYEGADGCPLPNSEVECGVYVCCNQYFVCDSGVECLCDPNGVSVYSMTVGSEINTYGFVASPPIGELELISGTDLGITELFSDGGEEIDVTFLSEFNCSGQSGVSVVSTSHPEIDYVLDSNVTDFGAQALDVPKNSFMDLVGETINVSISRLDCDQCNFFGVDMCPTVGEIEVSQYGTTLEFVSPEANPILPNGQELYMMDGQEGYDGQRGVLALVNDEEWLGASGDFIKVVTSNDDASVFYDKIIMVFGSTGYSLAYLEPNNKVYDLLVAKADDGPMRICLEDVNITCDTETTFSRMSSGTVFEIQSSSVFGPLRSGQEISILSGTYDENGTDITMLDLVDGERYIGDTGGGITVTFTDTITNAVQYLGMWYDTTYRDYRTTGSTGKDMFVGFANTGNEIKVCVEGAK